MPKLSIIIPVYNVEQYLQRCINSILNQTFTDFEAIFINDGSPDNCGKILDEYAEKDNRIVVIHQDNQGVSAARNAGIRIAQGVYLGFVDPDDFIESTMYEKMIDLMVTNNSDIVCCRFKNLIEDKIVENIPNLKIHSPMTIDEFVEHLFDSPRTVFFSVWNKVIKRDLITELFDESLKIAEDNLFLINYCKNAKIASYLDEALYCVFCRRNSATRRNIENLYGSLDVRRKIIDITKQFSRKCFYLSQNDYLDMCINYYIMYKKENMLDYCHIIKEKYLQYIRKNLINVLISNSKWKVKIMYLLYFIKE